MRSSLSPANPSQKLAALPIHLDLSKSADTEQRNVKNLDEVVGSTQREGEEGLGSGGNLTARCGSRSSPLYMFYSQLITNPIEEPNDRLATVNDFFATLNRAIPTRDDSTAFAVTNLKAKAAVSVGTDRFVSEGCSARDETDSLLSRYDVWISIALECSTDAWSMVRKKAAAEAAVALAAHIKNKYVSARASAASSGLPSAQREDKATPLSSAATTRTKRAASSDTRLSSQQSPRNGLTLKTQKYSDPSDLGSVGVVRSRPLLRSSPTSSSINGPSATNLLLPSPSQPAHQHRQLSPLQSGAMAIPSNMTGPFSRGRSGSAQPTRTAAASTAGLAGDRRLGPSPHRLAPSIIPALFPVHEILLRRSRGSNKWYVQEGLLVFIEKCLQQEPIRAFLSLHFDDSAWHLLQSVALKLTAHPQLPVRTLACKVSAALVAVQSAYTREEALLALGILACTNRVSSAKDSCTSVAASGGGESRSDELQNLLLCVAVRQIREGLGVGDRPAGLTSCLTASSSTAEATLLREKELDLASSSAECKRNCTTSPPPSSYSSFDSLAKIEGGLSLMLALDPFWSTHRLAQFTVLISELAYHPAASIRFEVADLLSRLTLQQLARTWQPRLLSPALSPRSPITKLMQPSWPSKETFLIALVASLKRMKILEGDYNNTNNQRKISVITAEDAASAKAVLLSLRAALESSPEFEVQRIGSQAVPLLTQIWVSKGKLIPATSSSPLPTEGKRGLIGEQTSSLATALLTASALSISAEDALSDLTYLRRNRSVSRWLCWYAVIRRALAVHGNRVFGGGGVCGRDGGAGLSEGCPHAALFAAVIASNQGATSLSPSSAARRRDREKFSSPGASVGPSTSLTQTSTTTPTRGGQQRDTEDLSPTPTPMRPESAMGPGVLRSSPSRANLSVARTLSTMHYSRFPVTSEELSDSKLWITAIIANGSGHDPLAQTAKPSVAHSLSPKSNVSSPSTVWTATPSPAAAAEYQSPFGGRTAAAPLSPWERVVLSSYDLDLDVPSADEEGEGRAVRSKDSADAENSNSPESVKKSEGACPPAGGASVRTASPLSPMSLMSPAGLIEAAAGAVEGAAFPSSNFGDESGAKSRSDPLSPSPRMRQNTNGSNCAPNFASATAQDWQAALASDENVAKHALAYAAKHIRLDPVLLESVVNDAWLPVIKNPKTHSHVACLLIDSLRVAVSRGVSIAARCPHPFLFLTNASYQPPAIEEGGTAGHDGTEWIELFVGRTHSVGGSSAAAAGLAMCSSVVATGEGTNGGGGTFPFQQSCNYAAEVSSRTFGIESSSLCVQHQGHFEANNKNGIGQRNSIVIGPAESHNSGGALNPQSSLALFMGSSPTAYASLGLSSTTHEAIFGAITDVFMSKGTEPSVLQHAETLLAAMSRVLPSPLAPVRLSIRRLRALFPSFREYLEKKILDDKNNCSTNSGGGAGDRKAKEGVTAVDMDESDWDATSASSSSLLSSKGKKRGGSGSFCPVAKRSSFDGDDDESDWDASGSSSSAASDDDDSDPLVAGISVADEVARVRRLLKAYEVFAVSQITTANGHNPAAGTHSHIHTCNHIHSNRGNHASQKIYAQPPALGGPTNTVEGAGGGVGSGGAGESGLLHHSDFLSAEDVADIGLIRLAFPHQL